jgi:hypothetical protein
MGASFCVAHSTDQFALRQPFFHLNHAFDVLLNTKTQYG